MDVTQQNRQAWNNQATSGLSEWSRPVSGEMVERARQGMVEVILTPNRIVPAHWLGELKGQNVLGLASAGGQQNPLLAAAGAHLTSYDNADEQLALDRFVAEREGLEISLERGDMQDLSRFNPSSFDLVFNPVSTIFVPDVSRVWSSVRRVLRPGGRLLTGVMNPAFYLFDHDAIETGAEPTVRFPLPYSTLDHTDASGITALIEAGEGIEFSHTLGSLIGDLLRSGFILRDFYEDGWSDEATPLNRFMKPSFAMLAEAV
ncbi:MAG: class I SAM-dependent methyltransferase [Alphaproteobacteria bacterium]|nr:class I SAM-dependent methyltransferase [Alphaproteobacteria bacterium]